MLNQAMQIACPACHTRYAVPDTAISGEGRTVRCAKCRHSWFQTREDAIEPAAEPVAEGAMAHASRAAAEPEMAEASAHSHAARDRADAPAQEPASAYAAPEPREEPAEPEPDAETDFVAPPQPAQADALVHAEADDYYEDEPETPAPEPDIYEDDVERPAGVRRMWIYAIVLVLLVAAGAFAAVRIYGMPDWVPIDANAFAEAPSDLVLDFPSEEQERRTMPDGQQFFAASGTITNVGSATRRVPPVLVVLRDAQDRIVYSWELDPPRRELEPGESLSIKEVVTDVPRSARIAEIGWKAS